MNENRIYITAPEMAEMLGISIGHAYKIIRSLNDELKKDGYIVIAGKVPKDYFKKQLVWIQRIRRYEIMKAQKDAKTGKWLIQFRYTNWQGERKKQLSEALTQKETQKNGLEIS